MNINGSRACTSGNEAGKRWNLRSVRRDLRAELRRGRPSKHVRAGPCPVWGAPGRRRRSLIDHPTRGRQSLRPFVDLNQGCKEQDEQCLSPSRFGQTKPNSIMFSMQLRRVWDAVLGRRHILGSAGGRTAPPAGNAPSGCKEQINHKLSLAGFGQTKPNSTMFSMQFSRVCDAA